MASKHIGGLPPRYSLAMNPYRDARFSRCPTCNRLTYPRKFALLIHIEGTMPMVLGKTCRYCPRCEIIIVHQDELEPLLAALLSNHAPQVIGNDYLVIGTVQIAIWKRSMREAMTLQETLPHTAEIAHYLKVRYEPGGWVPAGRKKR